MASSEASRRPGASARARALATAAALSLAPAGSAGEADGPTPVTLSVGGRLHLDTAHFSPDVTPLEDNTDVRRARLYAKAGWGDAWALKIEYELAGDTPTIKDAYVQLRPQAGPRLRMGHLQEPFSLEELISSNDLPLMERSLANALVPGYRVGALLSRRQGLWTLEGGVFAGPAADLGDLDDALGQGEAVVGRAVRSVEASGTLWHLGAAAELRRPEGSAVRYQARPESRLTDVRLVDTGTLRDVEHILTVGAEAAWRRGPFSVQGELIHSRNERRAAPDVHLHGGYVLGAWSLTGEPRPYSLRSARFGGLEPASAGGAWELAARASFLDLEDGAVSGGRETNLTLGLTWYPTERVRVMLNAVTAVATPNRRGVDEQTRALQARLQVVF